MILKEFPNLNWIREQSKSNFTDRRGINNIQLPQKGWPSVVLNTRTYGTERKDITAPFSLFLNVSGKSEVGTENRKVIISEDSYCLVNKGELYDLSVLKGTVTETFNIHFGDEVFEEVSKYVLNTNEFLLDDPSRLDRKHHVFVRSRWMDDTVSHKIGQVRNHYASQDKPTFQDEVEKYLLSDLLETVIKQTTAENTVSKSLSAQKKSTKIELTHRLFKSVDFIHDMYHTNPNLQVLSNIACLSQFHFLRVFKEVMGCTPHQYINRVKIDKAEKLLSSTMLPINEIAIKLGFDEPNSFHKFFKKTHQVTPMQYRIAN